MSWDLKLKERLAQSVSPEIHLEPARSSVLIAIGWNEEKKHEEIVLLKRTMTVETHKGQIAFPGGFHEESDPDLLRTALREAEEEIGARPADVQVLGALSTVKTSFNVIIVPWVAKFPLPYPFVINPAEVERLLYLPVQTLLTQGLKRVLVPVGMVEVESIGLHCDGELIWGATAKMLEELRDHLLAIEGQ